jgi:hypothetical protein
MRQALANIRDPDFVVDPLLLLQCAGFTRPLILQQLQPVTPPALPQVFQCCSDGAFKDVHSRLARRLCCDQGVGKAGRKGPNTRFLFCIILECFAGIAASKELGASVACVGARSVRSLAPARTWLGELGKSPMPHLPHRRRRLLNHSGTSGSRLPSNRLLTPPFFAVALLLSSKLSAALD